MAPTKKQFDDFNGRQVSRLDDIGAGFAGELDIVFRRYKALFKEALQAADFSEQTAVRLSQAAVIAEELEDYLEEAGLVELVDRFRAEHQAVATMSLEYFAFVNRPIIVSEVNAQAIDFLLAGNVEELFDQIDAKLVAPLRTGLIQGTFATRDIADIIEDVSIVADGLRVDQVQTLVNDSFQRFARGVRNEVAENFDALDVVVWSGPRDDKTSEQCGDLFDNSPHAPGVWLKEEFTVSRLTGEFGVSSALKEDPIIAGGHFNCRHEVNYISRDDAEEIYGVTFDG